MTKEEIIRRLVVKNHGTTEPQGWYSGINVFEAMDEYAKQEAVEFQEWCRGDGLAKALDTQSEYAETHIYTTTELYELFKTETK